MRALCHGFGGAGYDSGFIAGTNVRSTLHIGEHDTATWKLYKRLTIKNCREADHTKGPDAQGCKICSKPVCLACLVKHSIGKDEKTFLLRGRSLCSRCIIDNVPHSEHIMVHGSRTIELDYTNIGVCQCTSHSGILCLECKIKQNNESLHVYKKRCAGFGCDETIVPDASLTRVCLWCDQLFPTSLQKHYQKSAWDVADYAWISSRDTDRISRPAGRSRDNLRTNDNNQNRADQRHLDSNIPEQDENDSDRSSTDDEEDGSDGPDAENSADGDEDSVQQSAQVPSYSDDPPSYTAVQVPG